MNKAHTLPKMKLDQEKLLQEFDRQVENLIKKGYPKIAHITEQDFTNKITPLKHKLENVSFSEVDLEKGVVPFVIVIKSQKITAEKMMSLVEKDGKNGVTILRPLTFENFKTIDDVSIPDKEAYLLVDIDRGKEYINLPPAEALKLIKKSGRLPLTIEEGIAIVTQFPEFLMRNNCFSLLASRTGTDKRVPAIWINRNKEPNLGWCWDGNPHTWLGSVSCLKRVG